MKMFLDAAERMVMEERFVYLVLWVEEREGAESFLLVRVKNREREKEGERKRKREIERSKWR
jgi:hypothetical protein